MIKKAPYIIIAFLCLLAISWAIPFKETPIVHSSERIKIALREVGNRLLLSQQDSTSIIPPIVALDSKTYELSFEREFSFLPDSLVAIMDQTFEKSGISKNYIVEVIRCEDLQVSYSYEMHFLVDKTIVPCSGRQVPDACHKIQVKFLAEDSTISISRIGAALGALGILLFVGYRFRESDKKKIHLSNQENVIVAGQTQFYPAQNKLISATETHALSPKECEILSHLIARPNQIIKREELTKSVWEDNGVIVGRSLDTYISKLRKKLSEDASIAITNVHGVGYRLEIY